MLRDWLARCGDWRQTSRAGYNLVLRLDLTGEHMQELKSRFGDYGWLFNSPLHPVSTGVPERGPVCPARAETDCTVSIFPDGSAGAGLARAAAGSAQSLRSNGNHRREPVIHLHAIPAGRLCLIERPVCRADQIINR